MRQPRLHLRKLQMRQQLHLQKLQVTKHAAFLKMGRSAKGWLIK